MNKGKYYFRQMTRYLSYTKDLRNELDLNFYFLLENIFFLCV